MSAETSARCCATTGRHPRPGAPRARILRLCRSALRLRRGRRPARGAHRSTLRRDRRGAARRARGATPRTTRCACSCHATSDADGDRYARAADTLTAWEQSGVLVVDAAPRFYSYRMHFHGPHGEPRHTRGVIGAPDPSRARRRHERPAPRAHRRQGKVRPALAPAGDTGQRRPDLGTQPRARPHRAARPRHRARPLRRRRRRDPRARRHRRPRPRSPTSARAVASTPVVLADGHHRFETACAYRDELRAAGRDELAEPGRS